MSSMIMYATIILQNFNSAFFPWLFSQIHCRNMLNHFDKRERVSKKISPTFNVKISPTKKLFPLLKQHALKISMHKHTHRNALDEMNSRNILCGFLTSATTTLRYNLAHASVRKLNTFRAKPIKSTLYCCNAEMQKNSKITSQRCWATRNIAPWNSLHRSTLWSAVCAVNCSSP